MLAYKARPLNGILATPPNLHIGSVANLYELMLPAESSSPTFNLVSW
ncbi:MAG: c-type cytochrome [Gammaproteobacteria bacterium]